MSNTFLDAEFPTFLDNDVVRFELTAFVPKHGERRNILVTMSKGLQYVAMKISEEEAMQIAEKLLNRPSATE